MFPPMYFLIEMMLTLLVQWGSPEDFKGTAVYLASKASSYVSGHTLVVDGGWMGR